MFDEPQIFVVYVDLQGNTHGANIIADNRGDAIDCIEKAWNSNLLWHFKIYSNDHDDKNSIVRYGSIPWSIESISQVTSLARMQNDLSGKHKQLDNIKKELINSYSEKDGFSFMANRGHVYFYTSLEILRETYDYHRKELLCQGLNIPEIIGNEIIEIFEYAQKILKKLSEMKHFHSSSDNNYYAIRPSQYTAEQFIEKLPKLEDVFTSYKSREEWLKLRGL